MSGEPICFDVETVEILPDGTTRASTEFYRDNFRVASAAFTERAAGGYRSWFVKGEDAVRRELEKIGQRPIIAHNIQFEMGVTHCRFPDLHLNWYADTMRMVQNYDNGGDENSFEMLLIDPEDAEDDGDEDEDGPTVPDAKKVSTSGFGLVKAAKRILGKGDHKAEAYDWIRKNVPECKKGKEGSFLDRLPNDIMERYNVGDTETTYDLYEFLITFFLERDYDWRFDHELYLSTARFVMGNKARGVGVDRPAVEAYAEAVLKEIAAIESKFKQQFADAIKDVERERLRKRVAKLKTLKGRKNYIRKNRGGSEAWQKEVVFNVGSNKQLEQLFVDVLKMEAKFFTKKGSPAFKSAMLSQWGDGGLMLAARRKRLLVLKQACNLLKLTEYDGRWHCDLKLSGTATGRAAGGSQ